IAPAESALAPEARRLPDDVLAPLREEARSLGLWCLDAPAEHGGGEPPPALYPPAAARRCRYQSGGSSPPHS
ncbi:MAG: hypothetical protein ACXW4P_32840, partial [Thermoanaerobaculia bacterium]